MPDENKCRYRLYRYKYTLLGGVGVRPPRLAAVVDAVVEEVPGGGAPRRVQLQAGLGELPQQRRRDGRDRRRLRRAGDLESIIGFFK